MEKEKKNRKKKTLLLILLLLLLLIGAVVAVFFIKGGSEILKKLASSDTFNQGEYILPDYDVDGVLDESIWEDATCTTFGKPDTEGDEVTFKYYYGERGITAAFVVKDPTICYASNAYEMQTIYKLSDSVFLYLDVENNDQITPQTDDLKICIAADGRLAIAKGSGSNWNFTNESIDYQVIVDGELNKTDGNEQDVSWTAEFFIPYKTYGIDKDAVMGMMLEWGDSNQPSIAATPYYWYSGGYSATMLPEMFLPINKEGIAIEAPESWVPSMGRLVSDETNDLVADDIRAVAYYTGQKLQNGAGTVEATFDLTNAEGIFEVSRFSGLLLGVEEVGETEKPGWEAKNQYGVFISNSATNPQLVVSSIRITEEGKVDYKQIASGNILDALPNFVEDKICTVKVAKNDGWIEIYIKDEDGKYYHLYDVYDIEPINGDYIGIRTAVKGFAVRDIKVTTDAPAAPNPYKGSDVKVYSGLLQKLNDNEFYARTAGTTATFGSLVNKYNVKSLKTITTSITLPERPSKPEDKLKGILLNYNPDDQSYLILDYRHGEPNVGEWEEDWRFYIRERKSDGWGDVAFVMNAEGNTTYDFRITPIENAKGATEVFVEYKKSTDTEWKSTYCKTNGWKMSGSEYGVQTGTGDMKFGVFKVVDLGYTRLDESRYNTLGGMFFGRADGGATVMTGHSTVLDKSINLSGKDAYSIQTSYQVVPDKKDSIKGIVFNYDEKTGSYFVLDYRYVDEAYRLYVRQFDGKKWGATQGYDTVLTENAWYDFNIHVINGKKTTTVVVEYKTGDSDYTAVCRTFDVAMNGRQVGYYSTAANGMQFGSITVGTTNYLGAEDERYQLRQGAFLKLDDGLQVAAKQSVAIDTWINPSELDNYAFETSFKVVPDKADSIKGILLDYDEKNGSHLVLDYRYVDGAYRLYLRQVTEKGWGDTKGLDVTLTENEWYDFKISVLNGKSTTDVFVEYKTGSDDYVCVRRTFDSAMSGRKVGYHSSAANEIHFGETTTALTTYIGSEDEQYNLKDGAFFRINGGVEVASKNSILIDKTIDLSSKDSYQIETSFKVVPDAGDSIKGIIFNYNEETGSYLVLDYRYVNGAYRLYVRRHTETGWADVWGCGVELKVNAWYNFKIGVENVEGKTILNVLYKTGSDDYKAASKTFQFEMDGRQVGYYSTAANGMQFGDITISKLPKENGFTWPSDWSDALKKRKEQ